MTSPPPTVLVYSRDLFFSVRIQDVIERLGGRMHHVQNATDLATGLGEVPVLAIVELDPGGEGDWVHAVNYARRGTRGIPVVAFGSHVDAAARAAARQAGCQHVWAKSRFMEELPALVERYVSPSEDLQGCTDTPSELVAEGIRLFNAGEYYHCHDALEAAWAADRRPCRDLYQGILQLAIALHQVELGNYLGADKMFRRAINKFQRLPVHCQGFDAAELLLTCRDLHRTLVELGPEHIAAFPRSAFPTIRPAEREDRDP